MAFFRIVHFILQMFLMNNILVQANAVSGVDAPVNIRTTNFFVKQLTLANKLDSILPATEMSFVLSLLSHSIAGQPKHYILSYRGEDSDDEKAVDFNNLDYNDFFWNIQYVGKDGNIHVFESPVLNAHTTEIDWMYSIFEHFYGSYNISDREEFIYFLHNIDIIETLKMWLRNIDKNTAIIPNNVASTLKLEMFSRGAQANDRDVQSILQSLIDRHSYLPYQRDMLNNNIGNYTVLSTDSQAKDLYQRLIDGKLSETLRNNIISGALTARSSAASGFALTTFAFDLQTIIKDVINYFESNPEHLFLLNASQNFAVEMLSLPSKINRSLSPSNMVEIIQRIEQIYRALPIIGMIMCGAVDSLDYESLQNYYENHYALLPAHPEKLLNLDPNADIWSVLEAVFESYDWALDNSEKLKVFTKFTHLLNAYNNLKSKNLITSDTLRVLVKNMNAINMLRKNLKTYYLMIPKDYDTALDYTFFADSIPIKQKLTALSIMGIFTPEQENVIRGRVNNIPLSRGCDYYTTGDETAIQLDGATFSELNGKTVKDFVRDFCKDPKSTIVPHIGNMNLWDIYKKFITLHYEALEKTWDHSEMSILNLMFNDTEHSVLFDSLPGSGQILSQVLVL